MDVAGLVLVSVTNAIVSVVDRFRVITFPFGHFDSPTTGP